MDNAYLIITKEKTFDDIYTTPENILTDNMILYINKFPNIEELTINP